MEEQRRHTAVTSQNVCLKAWSESQGNKGLRWMEKIGTMCGRAADHNS